MFDILLSLCLAADPGICRTERHEGGGVEALCWERADALAAATAPVDTAQSWPCVPAGAPLSSAAFTRIAPGVFVRKGAHAQPNPENRGAVANVGLIIGEKSAALIDAGGSAADARAILDEVTRLTDRPLDFVILTHMHPDHTLGADIFQKAGARVIGHPTLPRAFAARREIYLEANARLMGPSFEGTGADIAIETAPPTLDLGARQLRLTPRATAHTDNDLTVLDETSGVLFLGDLLFVDHMPAVDGSILGWLALSEDLRLEKATAAVPGHGPAKVEWPAALHHQYEYLSGITETIRKSIATGETLLGALNKIDETNSHPWLLKESFHKRNIAAAFTELEWE